MSLEGRSGLLPGHRGQGSSRISNKKKKKKVSAPHSGEEGNLGDLIWTLKDEHFRANVFESEDNGTNG